eukprot:1116444-Prorocentrum_lima.AAC.1
MTAHLRTLSWMRTKEPVKEPQPLRGVRTSSLARFLCPACCTSSTARSAKDRRRCSGGRPSFR